MWLTKTVHTYRWYPRRMYNANFVIYFVRLTFKIICPHLRNKIKLLNTVIIVTSIYGIVLMYQALYTIQWDLVRICPLFRAQKYYISLWFFELSTDFYDSCTCLSDLAHICEIVVTKTLCVCVSITRAYDLHVIYHKRFVCLTFKNEIRVVRAITGPVSIVIFQTEYADKMNSETRSAYFAYFACRCLSSRYKRAKT